jgi:Family of unknown function (DUF5690)
MRRLLTNNLLLLNAWAFFAAFTTYFFMYMFRKPFTAAAYENVTDSVWDGKSVIVSAQVIGYFFSKLMGIRVVSAMPAAQRSWALLGLIVVAQLALLLFAVLPAPWHIVAIFFNGMPLGMVFGLVLGFLEGRRVTEALVAGLCASFILAGGVSKSVGQWTLNLLVNDFDFSLVQAERWMPFLAGSLFLIPIAVTTWMLAQIPPPTAGDTQARSERTVMTGQDRQTMLARYGIGLGAVAVVYLLVTILRSLRDDFAPQILDGMGATVKPSDYSLIDIQVALFVLVVNGLTALVNSNRLALQVSLVISLAGFAIIAVALTISSRLSPTLFMVLVGAGLYLPYVAVHTTIFERLIALTRDRGNMGFLMYIVDSLGYLGYVVVLFLPKSLVIGGGSSNEAFYSDFRWYCWVVAAASLVATVVALVYFSFLKTSNADEAAIDA